MLVYVAAHAIRAKGLALYAANDLPSGTLVTSFGRMKTAANEQFFDEDYRRCVLKQRQDSMIKHGTQDTFCYDTDFNVLEGNIPNWYYINHSRKRPNTECTLHRRNVAFFTIVPVRAGEELTFDYNVSDQDLGFDCIEK